MPDLLKQCGFTKVLEKVGFVLEARIKDNIYKWDRYEDELIYGIRKTVKAQLMHRSLPDKPLI